MRCTLVAIGPRGDVQPMLALGAGLRAAGVHVSVATHAEFADQVRAHGLELRVLQGDAALFFGGAAGVAIRDRLADARAFRRFFNSYLLPFYDTLLREVSDACADADVVIGWPWTRFLTSIADRFRIPVFVASAYPPLHLPTTAFPNPFQSTSAIADAASIRRSWRLAYPALQMGDASLNRWRQQTLGLPPIGWREDLRRLRRLPHLLGFSPAVLPRPADWAPWVDVTGFWFADAAADYTPPPELRAFLDAGPPPVAIGFSSQVVRDGEALARAVIDGVGQSGLRAVLLGGYGALARVAPTAQVCPVPSVPHAWLFPRVAAVVHHGGSGSTAEALRAGVPNMAVPFGYDQPLWGARLAALGVGPAPIAASALTADALAAALRQLTTDAGMGTRAAAVGKVIRSEDGVGRAVRMVLAD
jgi:UDP:flavonoid glycosyltransferase YjiC (YdhE family)